MEEEGVRSTRVARKCAEVARIIVKQEIRARVKQISEILKKPENIRTEDDAKVLEESPEIVKSAKKRANNRQLSKQRKLEVEDEEHVIEEKCHKLAEAIRKSKHLVIYTGAGISTAASIPDYRGPNGIWTLLGKGIQPKAQELSYAEPTYTHMAISSLYKEGKVEHLVSQNCDGLHLRSGYPKERLSELHGNMNLEWCRSCNPPRHYYRLFDVTERTALRRHATGRHCHYCNAELRDTIIHFGEKGPLCPPYQWQEAVNAVETADMILCLGSSLKVLRKYQCLWSLHVPANKRPKLYIVNLQWTPKDDAAKCKINGKCDVIMQKVMKHLGISIPVYERSADPLYHLATPLQKDEEGTTSNRLLSTPDYLQPFQDLLLPRHRQKARFRKRKANSVPRENVSSDKQNNWRNPSHRGNNSKDHENNMNSVYDSDTLDAPETLEILKMGQEKFLLRMSKGQEQKCSISSETESFISVHSNEPCERRTKEEVKSSFPNVYGSLQGACPQVKIEPNIQESQKSLHVGAKTVPKEEPENSYATVKSLLALSNHNQTAHLDKLVTHPVCTQAQMVCTNKHSSTPSTNVSSCQNVAVSAPMQVVSPFHHVPNNVALSNVFHSYCLAPTSSRDSRHGAFTSIRPTFTCNNQGMKPGHVSVPVVSDSNTITSPTSGCGGSIMQSLQVYKSLEDHDYCAFQDKKKDLKSDTQETNLTSYTSPGVHVPVARPPNQKTVAELLRERDASSAPTSVSSGYAQHNEPMKSKCQAAKSSSAETPVLGPVKMESVRLLNPNIKIQGNLLLRQFIPSNQRPVVYATAAVVDIAKLQQPVHHQIVPQVSPVKLRAGQTMTQANFVTHTVPVQCTQNMVSKQVMQQQCDHKIYQYGANCIVRNGQIGPLRVGTPATTSLNIPNLLAPQFTNLVSIDKSTIPVLSLASHVVSPVVNVNECDSSTKTTVKPPTYTSQISTSNVASKSEFLAVSGTPKILGKDCRASTGNATFLKENVNEVKVDLLMNAAAMDVSEIQLTVPNEKESAKTEKSDVDSSAMIAQEQNSPQKAVPGWFGKGFNCRKGRRKKGRLT